MLPEEERLRALVSAHSEALDAVRQAVAAPRSDSPLEDPTFFYEAVQQMIERRFPGSGGGSGSLS